MSTDGDPCAQDRAAVDELRGLAAACALLLLVFVLGRLFARLNAQLVGEILAGILAGPDALDLAPFRSALQLLGRLGLVLLVLEGGIGIRPELLPKIGLKALLIAAVGTALPVSLRPARRKCYGVWPLLRRCPRPVSAHARQRQRAPSSAAAHNPATLQVVLGWGFMAALGAGELEAIAAGAVLSSTSIGMARCADTKGSRCL